MDLYELTKKVTDLTETIYDKIIEHMKKNDVQVYSFIDKEEKPMIILDDEKQTKETIVALHYDGYTLGIMLESDLTPLRRKFLHKADKFPYDELTDREIEILSEESENGFDGFSLLLDSILYPCDTLLALAVYIEEEC